MKIGFYSSDFQREDIIDFSHEYGRIKYIDNGKVKYEDVVDAVGMDYQGKEVYISVSSQVVNSDQVEILFTLRNKRYVLKIK